jgi:acyl-CoA reductase-like NAD-dependent aldehyde dehydrogenase
MDPSGMRCKFGPVKHNLTMEKCEAFVEDALSKGGLLLNGGKRTTDSQGMG